MTFIHTGAFLLAGGVLATTLAGGGPHLASASSRATTSCPTSRGVSGSVGRVAVETRVDLYAEPKPEPSSLKVGDASYPRHLGSSQVTKDGCYAVPWPSATVMRRAADSHGVLNLRLVVQRSGQLQMRVFPGFLTRSAAGFTMRSGSGAASVAALGRAISAEQSSVEGELTESFASAGAWPARVDATSLRGRTAAVAVSTSDVATLPRELTARAPSGVRYVLERRFRDRPAAVGQYWSNTKRARERYVYAGGATSSLGAAWSVSGANGSYSASQTWTTATDNSMGFPVARGKAHRIYRTYFSYGKFAYQVYNYLAGKWNTVGHIVRRIRWEGGQGSLAGPSTPTSSADFCKPFKRGGYWNSGTTHAMTWSNGVDLTAGMKGVLGSLSLSSSSGFSRLAHNHVTFAKKARLCGWHDRLTGRPGALIARRPR